MLTECLDFIIPGRRERRDMVNAFFDKWRAIEAFESSVGRMKEKEEFYKPYFDYFKRGKQ